MTIEANVAWGNAVGTGTTGPFAIPFPLYAETWLTVLQVSNNVPTTMVLGTDYTFTSFTPDNKGQVQQPQITFTNVVPGGVAIIFLLTMPETQLTAITNYAAYFPNLTEAGLDTLTQMAQQIYEWARKSIKAPDQEQSGTTVLTLPPPTLRASLLLGFDGSGNVALYPVTTTSAIPFYPAANQAGLPVPSAPGSPALGYTADAQQYWGWQVVSQTWTAFT